MMWKMSVQKKTAFSLHTDQIDITVAFILEIAIEQTFVLKCQRKCHYRNSTLHARTPPVSALDILQPL